MKVLRVFNNNVVLARPEAGGEVIATGRGIGFQARPGDAVDPARVVKVFVPSDGRDPDTLATMLSAIPPELVQLTDEVLAGARATLGEKLGISVVVAVADHLNFALHRARQGIELEFPLEAEIAHLYPHELAAAQAMVAAFNERLDTAIPAEEAVPLAMHLVNAGFSTGDLSETYQMTGVFRQIFDVVSNAYGQEVNAAGISAARFITHLRYFFVRVREQRQLADGHSALLPTVRAAYPSAYACALKIQSVLELRLGHPITDDEVVYLTMHVRRLTSAD